MYLKSLNLLHYKNITEANYVFDAKINAFVGANGKGKTNLLDAVYHLCFGKSYFNPLSVQNIQHGQEFFVIEGEFEREQREEHVVVSYKKGQKKVLKRNAKPYERFSEHIGLLPCVLISPADQDLISEGSDVRRAFMDSIISQLNTTYLQQLIQYQKLISQRNALLKYFAANRTFDASTLEVFDLQLIELTEPIFASRQRFMEDFTPIFHKYYNLISQSNDQVEVRYDSQLHTSTMPELFEQFLSKDRVLQYTSVGVHKDDLRFEIQGHPIKKFGSQGQQKTFLIALKLAQFEFIRQVSGNKPILLFDDIFDKLDANRVQQIVTMVNNDVFGQIFISDTHAQRSLEIMEQTAQSYKLFTIE